MSKKLDELWNKAQTSDIEACILWVADDGTKAAVELAEKAIIELAALRACIAELERQLAEKPPMTIRLTLMEEES